MIHVTAVVCTRNRPKQIGKAVSSLLAGSDDTVELVVIDQSPGSETELALAAWRSDPRLTYHRTQTIGKSVGLNLGVELARGSVVVFTDDDCEVPPGWARAMAAVLERRPRVALVFCNVTPVPHDPTTGYVPAYQRTRSRIVTSLAGLRDGLGLGAGMAIRRDVVLSLGGFDESFGPGARFPSADEWDIAIRLLVSGWHIFETPELSIVHDGYRSFVEGREHARRDWVALGAVCAKPLRGGHLRAVVVPLYYYPVAALWAPLSDLLHMRRPRGLVRITAFLRGFANGMQAPMDQRTLRYLPHP
jgi:glycosyltransferase involved in cell wall biosynthesis